MKRKEEVFSAAQYQKKSHEDDDNDGGREQPSRAFICVSRTIFAIIFIFVSVENTRQMTTCAISNIYPHDEEKKKQQQHSRERGTSVCESRAWIGESEMHEVDRVETKVEVEVVVSKVSPERETW